MGESNFSESPEKNDRVKEKVRLAKLVNLVS